MSRAQQAFDKSIKEGKKAYVKFDRLGFLEEETIQVIHASGGFAVLAHPTRSGSSATNIRYLIEIFAQFGGDAVEVTAQCRTDIYPSNGGSDDCGAWFKSIDRE